MHDALAPRTVSTTLRTLLLRPAALLALAIAGDAAQSAALERVVVTATRRPAAALATPLSVTRLAGEAIAAIGPTHQAELLNRAAGAYVQRGSGQESLTALRSPVLTGAGACGAFLFLENGIPIRPVGSCNVNELFEVNTEQAAAIELLRGPGSALYGSNAVHGAVNVLQPGPGQRPALALGLDTGPQYLRLRAQGEAPVGTAGAAGGSALYARDTGWRDDSGYDEAKLNLVLGSTDAAGSEAGRQWNLAVAATHLEQETAGFIVGKDAYADAGLARRNPNPEAFRDADALRLSAELGFAAAQAQWTLRPYLRHSRMEFLQHFLLGQPLERNGQDSYGLMGSARWGADVWSLIAGLDLEAAESFLEQSQDAPTIGGSPAANAIRPVGKHYDYAVDSTVVAAYAHLERDLGERWRLTAGLRAEQVRYDYDNRMLAGNTDQNGVPCPFGGCLYSRPADRTDTFAALAPKLALGYALTASTRAYLAWAEGFRPPETGELYRLQRTQSVADLDGEHIEGFELGLKGEFDSLRYALAAFDLDKRDVILRDSAGFNVDGGRTSHRGLELELDWQALPTLGLAAAGTWARHRYEFDRAIEGGERIAAGNDVDTAPRHLYTLRAGWTPTPHWRAEAEWLHVGEYWLEAGNTRRYGGHDLLNLRGAWQPAPRWLLSLRLVNALDRAYADRADFAFGNYRYFPGRGRTLFASLDWQPGD
jgi:outer membrane receptor protein involved in Fe transport